MEKEQIIIVGAGIAGLVLARELAGSHDVTIIEAAERPGGRIHSFSEKGFPVLLEAGAEFIHGNLKHTMRLLDEAGIDYVEVQGELYDRDKGKWKKLTMMIEDWDELLKKMKTQTRDMTMNEFLEIYFPEDKYHDLRRHTISYAEGFDVADIRKVSMKALYKEWSAEEQKNYRIPAGYSAVIDFLVNQCREKGCRIYFNEAAKQIDWEKNDVTVHTSAGEKYEAKRVVVTVPLSVLQRASGASAINFSPALHEQVHAAGQIGYGPVVKVKFLFRERFWKDDTAFIFNNQIFPTWWTQLPDETPLLTGWAGGPKAEYLSKDNNNKLVEKGIGSLAHIFDIPAQKLEENLEASRIFNWQRNEWALGAYSYTMPESIAARQLLNEPVQDTIYFSGEGIYDGDSPGTVEASIAHAKQVAAKLK